MKRWTEGASLQVRRISGGGKSGLSLAMEHLPDLVICDIMMPEAGGYEVLNGLRRDLSTRHIPFIFLMAGAEKKAIETGLAMGANSYISKPFEPEELFEAIKRCFDASS